MKAKLKSSLLLIAFGVALFAVFMNFEKVLGLLESLVELVFPILLGLLIAFVLNVPMTGFEHLLERFVPEEKREKLLPPISLFLTLASIILVLVLAFTLLIPTIAESVRTIAPLLQEKWPQWIDMLNSYGIDTSSITNFVSSLDLTGDFSNLFKNLDGVMGSLVSGVRSTISGFTSTVFGLVIAIYVLSAKKKLGPQVRKLVYAYLKPGTADKVFYVGGMIRDTYAKFLSGQCVEAIILGALIFLSFTIFRLPYAALIGFLTALFAFVPYVGALASCVIGACLILLVDPMKALISIIVYVVVQFIENQFIYPRVVGGSVGLSPLLTLVAALIGGNLFGLVGIIFFIPLAAVVYNLLRDDMYRRYREREDAAPVPAEDAQTDASSDGE